MFSLPIAPDKYHEEGIVIQVFPESYTCAVRTSRGKMMTNVQWGTSGGSSREGNRGTISMGDQVLLYLGLGRPIVLLVTGRAQIITSQQPLNNIHTGENVTIATSSVQGGGIKFDSNRAADFLPGDRLMTSAGGSTVAALRGGSVLLRAGRNAEVLLSRIRGLARVFASNWEHFTDLSSDVIKNFKGRVYRYVGYARTPLEGLAEAYKLHFYYGDVQAAKQIKTAYGTSTVVPTTSDIIYEEQVTDNAGLEVFSRVVSTLGETTTKVQNTDSNSQITQTATQITLTAESLRFNGETRVEGGLYTTGALGSQLGATGTFTTATGLTVTVQDGIITNIF